MCKVEEHQTSFDDKGRNWTTSNEVEALRKGAKFTRNGVRNELIVLMLYRHGLRESELCNLRLDYVDFEQSKIHIKRLKGSNSFTQPVRGDEMRLLKRYLKTREGKTSLSAPWLFVSERGNQLSRFTVIKLVETSYQHAQLRKITPHMLRHGCGYYLANKGVDLRVIQDYLGHKNVQNTVIYTRLAGKQFENLWD